MVRRTAVAGSWYPAKADRLQADVQEYLAAADELAEPDRRPDAALQAVVVPHAGLVYSGPVAAHAYRLLHDQTFDAVVLVGPSHYVPFSGVSIWPAGSFDTPLGRLRVDEELAAALRSACDAVHVRPDAHAQEHSLEMQLPFLAVLVPDVPILPLVMGHQTRDTAFALAEGLARVLAGRRALLVASSDLSHFFDAATAATLDAQVIERVEAFDPDGLMARLERRPEHACGGGPIVAVLAAARRLGATTSRVVRYADSGDVSGDKQSVVGYLAAAVWQ